MPPCAATVCDLVGNSFVTQAVLKPASAQPMAALRPAPPAPTTRASYSWSTVVIEGVTIVTKLEKLITILRLSLGEVAHRLYIWQLMHRRVFQ